MLLVQLVGLKPQFATQAMLRDEAGYKYTIDYYEFVRQLAA